ncbi:MAG: AraC family transcriptional regulator [Limnochordia bacterium]|nr:AraC family transcriptional regulator [Limnochordia bacterium]MDD4517590.1 AraC family transcriptional regulator [Limnochordia bacterium]
MEHPCDLYSKSLWACPYSSYIVYYYRRNFAPGYSLTSHGHGQAEIMYVESGEITLEFPEKQVDLQASDFVVINGGVYHGKLPVVKECRITNCEFFFEYDPSGVITTLSVARKLNQTQWPFAYGHPWLKGTDTGTVGKALADLVELLDSREEQLLIDLAFWRLFAELSLTIGQPLRSFDVPNLHVNRAIRFMRARYSWDLSIEDISKHLQLNRSYFSRIFKEVTNQTPNEYLTRLRIKQAKKLLVTTDLSIIDICQDVGIKNQQHFSKLFSRYVGVAPSTYRREYEVKSSWRGGNRYPTVEDGCDRYLGSQSDTFQQQKDTNRQAK